VTNGGPGGPDGERPGPRLLRDPRAVMALAFAALGALYMAVNAASMIDQRLALGRPIPVWQAWVLEGTSFIAWLALLPLVLAIAGSLAKRPVWQALIGHLGGCIALSLAHTMLMMSLRIGAFALAGDSYAPAEPWSARLVFEARKDVITYVSVVAGFLVIRQLLARSSDPAPRPAGEPALIEVRDGNRVVMLRPEEIDWVSAAGNYVELHGAFGCELARRTLADMAAELAPHGFVQIHRSRLVRRGAIQSMATRQSGDVDITLRSGEQISGSRRYRGNLG
jgi:hypothetical protein